MSLERKIRLFSTTGIVSKEPIISSSTNFDDLKKELAALGVDLSGKSVTEYKSQSELKAGDTLPEGDLRLFVMPEKTNSGFKYRVLKITNM